MLKVKKGWANVATIGVWVTIYRSLGMLVESHHTTSFWCLELSVQSEPNIAWPIASRHATTSHCLLPYLVTCNFFDVPICRQFEGHFQGRPSLLTTMDWWRNHRLHNTRVRLAVTNWHITCITTSWLCSWHYDVMMSFLNCIHTGPNLLAPNNKAYCENHRCCLHIALHRPT